MTEPPRSLDVVARILEGQAPRPLRSAAARGALPLGRAMLVRLYLFLRGDEDVEIRAAAEASLKGLGRPEVVDVVADEECPAEVLEHFAGQALRDDALAELIVFHHAAPSGALVRLAEGGSATVIDLVLTNQERLLTQPVLLDCLSRNPALRAEQRGRILELLDRAMQAAARATSAASEAPLEATGEITDEVREAARLLQLDIGELFAASEILGAEELAQSEDVEIRTAYQRILMLNVAQKAVLAMRGGREERMILVRDTNKLVALGVLRNPRLVEDDVESISRMRNVTDEVLRVIGQSREWRKSYAVINALVNNPRTPQGVSANFVPRLQNQDLKRLAASKDVPELIRRMAKRTLELRTQKK